MIYNTHIYLSYVLFDVSTVQPSLRDSIITGQGFYILRPPPSPLAESKCNHRESNYKENGDCHLQSPQIILNYFLKSFTTLQIKPSYRVKLHHSLLSRNTTEMVKRLWTLFWQIHQRQKFFLRFKTEKKNCLHLLTLHNFVVLHIHVKYRIFFLRWEKYKLVFFDVLFLYLCHCTQSL